jgi:hypothetical protein
MSYEFKTKRRIIEEIAPIIEEVLNYTDKKFYVVGGSLLRAVYSDWSPSDYDIVFLGADDKRWDAMLKSMFANGYGKIFKSQWSIKMQKTDKNGKKHPPLDLIRLDVEKYPTIMSYMQTFDIPECGLSLDSELNFETTEAAKVVRYGVSRPLITLNTAHVHNYTKTLMRLRKYEARGFQIMPDIWQYMYENLDRLSFEDFKKWIASGSLPSLEDMRSTSSFSDDDLED